MHFQNAFPWKWTTKVADWHSEIREKLTKNNKLQEQFKPKRFIKFLVKQNDFDKWKRFSRAIGQIYKQYIVRVFEK